MASRKKDARIGKAYIDTLGIIASKFAKLQVTS